MTRILDLDPPAHQLITLVAGTKGEQMTAQTPCEGTSVAAMLDHLMGLTMAFRMAARKETPASGDGPPPGPGMASADNLDPGWRRRLPEQLEELAAAWKDPAAWEGMTQAGGVTM